MTMNHFQEIKKYSYYVPELNDVCVKIMVDEHPTLARAREGVDTSCLMTCVVASVALNLHSVKTKLSSEFF